MPKKPSLAEIAKSLGVSKTLVSLVVNNKADEHGISQDTQQRVRDKISALNYKPDLLAQGFRTGKTKTIGLIVSDISNLFYARIARKIEDFARIHGFSVVICSTDENIEKEINQINLLRSRKVEGLIISTSQESGAFFDKLTEEGLPHVLIDRTFDNIQSASVCVDNYAGAKMAARHLLNQGFTRIGMISISPQHISTIREREKGFKEKLKEGGIEIPQKWHIKAPFSIIEASVEESLQNIYESGEMPEAFFTLNNKLTANCLKYLRKLSLEVPGQIALIGFDDVIYFDFTQPSVSAIAQPIDVICENAFALLIKQINKNIISPEERSVTLDVDLIIRESSIKQNEQS